MAIDKTGPRGHDRGRGTLAVIGRARSVSIYRSLLTNLAMVVVLLSAAIMALTFVDSQRTVRRLSAAILQETIGQVELRLQGFVDPVTRDLALLRAWSESGLLDVDDPAGANRLLAPLLRSHPELSAAYVSDERGRQHILFHVGETWQSRQTRRDVWGDRNGWLEWTDGQPRPVASWRRSDYDPRRRPWYQGAIEAWRAAPPAPAGAAPPINVYWTAPYVFYTLKAPGITARRRSGLPTGACAWWPSTCS